MRGVPMDGNAPHHFNHRRNPEIQDSMNAVLYLTHKKLQYGMNANSTTRISCVRIHADIEPLFADFLLTLCYD